MKNKNEIVSELQEIAPELSKIEKKNSIQVSASYFTSFSELMMKKIQEQELQETAPTLSQLEKPNPEEVPANYFNSFSQQILERISKEEKRKTAPSSAGLDSLKNIFEKLAAVIFRPKFAFAIAGTVSLVIVGIMLFINLEQTQCAEGDLLCQLENVSDEELDAYFLSHSDDFQKSILDYSTDDKSLQKVSKSIDTDLEQMLNQLDDKALNEIFLN